MTLIVSWTALVMDILNACLILIGLVIDSRSIFQLGFVVSIWCIIQLRTMHVSFLKMIHLLTIAYILSYMFQRLRVWCKLPNRQWELGQIQSTSGEKSTVLLLDGAVSS